MIYLDDSTVKVSGVVLPGLFKSMEIKSDAQIDEQTVEGQTAKPKQATGYEDAKITLELLLDDSAEESKQDKLSAIQQLFRTSGQSKPTVHTIVSDHTATRGISRVIFKSLSSREQNSSSLLIVTLEFWEYVPITITASKSVSGSSSGSSSNLHADYQEYLSSDRGEAPKQSDKASSTVAQDDRSPAYWRDKMKQLEM